MKNQNGKKDFFWFSIIAFAILAFSSLPYWVARSAETDELLFRGIYFDEMDYSVHISMMQAGRMGDWGYQMRFTSEEHRSGFLRMFYIILGHISKWINMDVETTFHFARWVFGFFALYAIYQLCRKILPNPNQAWAAFLLAVLGAGAGWFQLILGTPLQPISPIDFWLIDAYIFFSISLFPSFSFSLAMMAWALNLFLSYLEEGKWQTVLWICLLAVLSQTTNPIAFAGVDTSFAGAIILLWWKNGKVESRNLLALFVIAIAQIPLLIYNFLILKYDPFWSQFTFQNQTLSPPPLFYFWGFFPYWLFALYGIILAFHKANSYMAASATWVVSGFALAYLPVFIQRRFIFGITIPLAILAIYGLSHFLNFISVKLTGIAKREGLAYFAYILLSSISAIYLFLGMSLFMQALPTKAFYPRDLENAMVWLDKKATPNDFVLANISSSQLVAQRTKLKVFVGHEVETIDFESKKIDMEYFYMEKLPDEWLKNTPIQWVIYGPYEKEISSSFAASSKLKMVYQNDSVIIYKVER